MSQRSKKKFGKRANTHNHRPRKPSGMRDAEWLHTRNQIKQIEREIAEYERVQKEKVVVEYDGKSHTFQPFWTRAPRASKRPVSLRGSELRQSKKAA